MSTSCCGSVSGQPIQSRQSDHIFSRQLDIGIDLLLCDDTSLPDIEQMMEGSILLASRDAGEHPEHQADGSGQANSSEGQVAG
ncbi:hypothetical protein [Chloroflexus sp.]|uniref:hypothetical protein n=1 Tax=Chloroflexus sp. TaxID=1904827 RepID=UPI002ADD499E|nr:hypothetical protein [Chloroflexus sp.]